MTDSHDLASREAKFRSQLDPTLSQADLDLAVATWLERQPEARPGHIATVTGQIIVAREALVKARDAAEILGWDVLAMQLTERVRELASMEQAVGEVEEDSHSSGGTGGGR